MGGVVVVKLGGGLITHKDKLCTVNTDVLESLAKQLSKSSKRLVIIHGAGSFGHLKAREYRLAEGDVEGLNQSEAIESVRADMIELNSHVTSVLKEYGMNCESFPPHQWVNGIGPDFSGDLPYCEGTTVVFGDVVDDPMQQFGILSGDDLIVRYAIENPDVERVVFAIGGVDGILRVPPADATPEDLIEIWSSEIEFEGEHVAAIDVTGGIGLKAQRGSMIAKHGIDVMIVNGEHPTRLLDAIEGKPVRGTRIIHPVC